MAAEVVVGVGEGAPGGGLAVAVAEFLEQGQRLLAVAQGLPVLAEQRVVPADGVEDTGVRGATATGPEQLHGQLVVAERAGQIALLVMGPAEAAMGVGPPDVVAQLGEEPQRTVEAGARRPVQTEPASRPGQRAQAPGLPRRVGIGRGTGRPQGRVERDPLDRRPVVPVPPSVEERLQRPGEQTRHPVAPGPGRRPDDGEQHRILGGQPGERLLMADERFGLDAGRGGPGGTGSAYGARSCSVACAVCR